MIRSTITCIVNQINGSGPGHYVDGKTEYEKNGADDDADEIVVKVEVQLVEIVEIHLGSLDGGYYNQRNET